MLPNIDLPLEEIPGQPFAPTESASLSANGDGDVYFRGRDGKRFGIYQVLFWSDGPLNEIETTWDKDTAEGNVTLISNVHVSAIDDYFAHGYRMDIPLIVEGDRQFHIDYDELAGSAQEVSVMVKAWDHRQLEVIERAIRRQLGTEKIPRKRFLHGRETIGSGVTNEPVQITSGTAKVAFDRFAVGTDAPDQMQVDIINRTRTVKEAAYPRQINREFAGRRTEVPHFTIAPKEPWKLRATNNDGANSHEISIFAEGRIAE